MSDGVHLLIPFAARRDEDPGQASALPPLPQLGKLLSRLKPAGADEGEARMLSMPHERVLAREFALGGGDGLLPWAAWQVQQSGRDAGGEAWAWITPCHWRVGTGHIAMGHPGELQLDPRDSRALLSAMQPYFEQDGLLLEYDAPTRWLARGEIFRTLPSASLDRVVGRVIDPWLARTEAARPLRRLQQEMQMLLYTHPVNDERTRGGLLPVNSFWISGTGALPDAHQASPSPGLTVMHALRDTALQGDGAAWAAAWRQLDAQEGPRLLQALAEGREVRLTLCGERNARSWSSRGAGPWRRLASMFARPSTSAVLASL